jgi:hypothetical protein
MRNRMGNGALALAVAAGLALGMGTVALAQEKAGEGEADSAAELVTGTTIDLIVASFERNGLPVEVTEDSKGAPEFKSTKRDALFYVNFYGCNEEGDDCGYIQITAGWDLEHGITLAKIEKWNAEMLWGVAYRNQAKDPWLGMTVNLRHGVTIENLDDTVDLWRVIYDRFEDHIGWNEE